MVIIIIAVIMFLDLEGLGFRGSVGVLSGLGVCLGL